MCETAEVLDRGPGDEELRASGAWRLQEATPVSRRPPPQSNSISL